MDDDVGSKENDFGLDETPNEDGRNRKSDIVVPKVGMEFDEVEEVYEFYRKYAAGTGFGCKTRSSKKDDGILRHVTYTCVRNGKHKTTSTTPFELDPTGKCECKAKLSAILGVNLKWRITVFVPEHTHLTSPSKIRFMRCNKLIKKSVKRKILINDKAGLEMYKNFNICAAEAGGVEHLTYDEKDLRNMVAKEKRLKLGEGDATALINHFERMQNLNEDFFYRIDLGDDGRLRNVFWADKRCREAYKEFGEVVTFDTTYLTNKYAMPFAPFVGVNHHGQSTLFGCGLISNEEIDTFVWLFQAWLDCMKGSAPPAILMDQCSSMKAAVERVFPQAKHRWCLWHIMKKIPEKLSSHKKYQNIKCRLKRAVYDTTSPTEFEQSWSEMLEKYPKLRSSRWLNTLYKEKDRWVPCYVNTTFWAGMSTTQRSESMNAFFDGYVHSRTTLSEFVEQYDNALRSKVEKELKADARSFSKVIPTTTSYEIEEQMQNVYTIEKFQEIQKELTKKIYCEIIDVQDEIQDGIQVTRYDVQQEIWYYRLPFVEDEDGNSTDEDATAAAGSDQEDIIEVNNIPTVEEGEEDEHNPKAKKVMKHVVFKVWYEKDECKVKCSCCMFEFRGLLCTHALYVLLRNKVTSIPERYILRRCRKDVKLAHSKVSLSSDSWQLTPEEKRYKELCDYFAELADIASRDDDECNDIKKWIGEQLKLITEKVPKTMAEVIHTEVNKVIEVQNPRVVPTKGRPCKNTSKPKVYRKKANKGKENTEVRFC
ncbi:hypothetical protein MKX03_034676 [Papaver bracteatum]|nr:hypothetical protein MKX03_034676 [Papaver bracteatum]